MFRFSYVEQGKYHFLRKCKKIEICNFFIKSARTSVFNKIYKKLNVLIKCTIISAFRKYKHF